MWLALSAFAHRTVRRRHAVELLLYSTGLVALLCLLASWIVAQALAAPPAFWPAQLPPPPPMPWSTAALADVFSLGLLGLALFVIVPAQVAATVAQERRSGTLDQLRSTPLSPLHLLAGVILGAPARLYLLCVGPLLFHVGCGLLGVIPFEALSSTLVVLLVGGLASSVVAAVIALAPVKETGGAFVALAVAALLGCAGLFAACFAGDTGTSAWAFFHPAGALHAAMLAHDGLWRRLFVSDWSLERFSRPAYLGRLAWAPLASVLLSACGGLVMLRAACRKLAAPHLPLLSKLQAVALFAIACAALILPMGRDGHSRFFFLETPLIAGLLLLPVLGALALGATPSFEAWALALRRGRRPGAFADERAPLVATAVMVATYFALFAAIFAGDGFSRTIPLHNLGAFAWAAGLALSLPIFALFATTRFQSQASRVAFAVAICAHLIAQTVGIGMLSSDSTAPFDRGFVELTLAAALLVPAWVIFRQRALKRRILIGA